MKNKFKVLSTGLLVVLGMASQNAPAVSLTGTYTLGGATTGTGPWNMTSTDTTFSVLRFVLDTPTAFQNITSLSYTYDSNLGGIAGGAPRAAFVYDSTGDNVADGQFLLVWGPAGTFVDPTIGDNLTTGNLIALTDVGRYDLSGSLGGSAYTDRTAALAAAGTFNILRISLIVDSFGGADRNFDILGVSADGRVVAAPDAGSTLSLLGIGFAGLVAFNQRRKSCVA